MNFLRLRKESGAKISVKCTQLPVELIFQHYQLFLGKPVKISERTSKRKVIFGKSLRNESGSENSVKCTVSPVQLFLKHYQLFLAKPVKLALGQPELILKHTFRVPTFCPRSFSFLAPRQFFSRTGQISRIYGKFSCSAANFNLTQFWALLSFLKLLLNINLRFEVRSEIFTGLPGNS